VALVVTFWGTRGSIPRPGRGTVGAGGNTPCLTIESGHGSGRLILDAGTGIRDLGRALVQAAGPDLGELTILLSHTHWDHIQGLPFFEPLYRPDVTARLRGPRPSIGSLGAVIRAQMEPAVFPVPLAALAARLLIEEFDALDEWIGPFHVRTTPVCHPGATVGYSVAESTGGPRVSYLTDNELGHPSAAAARAPLVQFLQGTDTLVHDAMYLEREVSGRVGWGHSSASEAVSLAVEARCRRLVLFHHHPDHDDATLEELLAEAFRSRDRQHGQCEIVLAAEGTSLRC
jgi:phosphoribosyl 1,2-cyclic phosphodiesterase